MFRGPTLIVETHVQCVCVNIVRKHTHARTHIHTHKYMHARTHIHTHKYMHARTHIHTHKYMHARTHIHTHTFITFLGSINYSDDNRMWHKSQIRNIFVQVKFKIVLKISHRKSNGSYTVLNCYI
jgi:hypothetical protein